MKSYLTEKCLKNARRDIRRFKKAEKETLGSERAKYRQGIDNLERYVAVLLKEDRNVLCVKSA